MGSQLVVVVVVEPLDRGVLESAVHSLDLAIGPRIVGFGQSVLNAVRRADHVEANRPGIDGVAVPGLLGELDAVVGQDRVDLAGHGFEHVLKELPSCLSVSSCNELSDNELGCSVDPDEEKELSLSRLH